MRRPVVQTAVNEGNWHTFVRLRDQQKIRHYVKLTRFHGFASVSWTEADFEAPAQYSQFCVLPAIPKHTFRTYPK